MALLISGFEGLGDADFDVYRQVCWSNNLHNLDRMRTKARVVALVAQVRAAAGEADLVAEASSEIPSVWNGRQVRDQWAYLLRAPAARRQLQPVMARSTDLATQVKDPAEHHQHALLAVRLDNEILEIGLRIHQHATVDLANLIGHAEADATGLNAALAGLGELVLADGSPVQAGSLVAAARAVRQGQAEWLVVARRVPRAEATAAGIELAERVVATAEALLPLYRFAAWSAENDFVGVQQQTAALAEEVEQRREVAEAELKVAEAERETRRSEARERTEAQVAELRAWKAGLRSRREEQVATRETHDQEARQRREAEAAEHAAHAEEHRLQREAEAAERAVEDAARAADIAERVARARLDAQEAIRQAAARREAATQRAQAEAARPAADPARPAAPRRDEPRRDDARRGPAPGGPRPAAGQRPPRRDDRPADRAAPADEAPRVDPPRDAPRKVLAVGDRCRLDRGLLAGKEGVVRAVDTKKGYYQVRVGVLDVNIAFAEAIPVS